ncbi:dnaj homolog subfamily c member 27-like [Stylonychia lemnae]|uniref:Dnaj homolog subfamily c member 27-like n=1 Tax=Stylonychia lemnae TaxID=5949 RepID=A0A078AKJ7_STYLE|nr:dnaj homolog subfamily c member 27-like [Stylonychia lemnae]|eukprot:CDW82401.1 dnaj homolog subfamily c member 27-like [Stylonychia lemnae]
MPERLLFEVLVLELELVLFIGLELLVLYYQYQYQYQKKYLHLKRNLQSQQDLKPQLYFEHSMRNWRNQMMNQINFHLKQIDLLPEQYHQEIFKCLLIQLLRNWQKLMFLIDQFHYLHPRIKGKKLKISMDEKIKFKVCLIGDGGVGKSSIVQRLFMGQTYNPSNNESIYNPTVGSDFFTKSYQIGEDRYIQLNIWDLSGHPEFYKSRQEFYKDTQVLIYVFDHSFKESFDNLNEWYREFQNSQAETPILTYLVVNKVKSHNLKFNQIDKPRDKYLEQYEVDDYAELRRFNKVFQTSVYQSNIKIQNQFLKQIKDLVIF